MMITARRLKLLLICNYTNGSPGTLLEHKSAFAKFSNHHIVELNMLFDIPSSYDLNNYDALIIHDSICIALNSYLSKETRQKIRNFSGLKIVFIQDDYRFIFKTLAAIDFMKINVIFGLAPEKIKQQIYLKKYIPTVQRVETVLPGYIAEENLTLPKRDFNARTIDVGYRARKCPYWFGEHTLQKWQIGDKFLQDNTEYRLSCDISWREEDRIYGKAWLDFLSNCKAVLGTESGTSVCDFTGKIQLKTEQYLQENPDATFKEVQQKFLKGNDGKILLSVISPRFFEAAATGTLMILYEGNYSGILKPYRHYIPLAKDHSNMSEVIEYLRDEKKWSNITQNAYKEIALNPKYHYEAMIAHVDKVILEEYYRFFTFSEKLQHKILCLIHKFRFFHRKYYQCL